MGVPDLESDDYYKILGVNKDASEADIKKAFRRLAIKYHPDKAKGDKEKATDKFKKISEAYEVLSDKEKRQTYDQFGKAGQSGQGFQFHKPEDIFSQFFGSSSNGDPFANMFSESFFSGGGDFETTGGFGHSFGHGMPGHHGHGGMEDLFSQIMGGSGMGMGLRSNRRRSVKSYDCYKRGTLVFLKNLKNQTYLNDYQGVIKSFDRSKQRYLVQVDDDAVGEKSLRRENLMQLIRDVVVVNLKSKPHLNGKRGILFDFDHGKRRGIVRVEKQNMSLSCENLIFPEQTVVEISGLQKGVQYNKRMGTIVGIDMTTQRYTIQLSETEKLSVKFGNVVP